MQIPEIINAFNVYSNGSKFVGVSSQVKLPNMQAITEEISGAAVMGSYESSIPGFFNSMEQEIPFRSLDDNVFELMDPTQAVDVTLRGSLQTTDSGTYAVGYEGMRVVMRGRFKGFDPGTIEQGKKMEPKVTLEILYFLLEVNGKTMYELDKLNFIFKVNGKDLLQKIRNFC